MAKAPPTPPMYEMSQPFEQMNGEKIQVTLKDGSKAIGSIVTYNDRKKGLFGVRIDIIQPPVMVSPPPEMKQNRWATVGHVPVLTLLLSKEEIEAIQKEASPKFAFSATYSR